MLPVSRCTCQSFYIQDSYTGKISKQGQFFFRSITRTRRVLVYLRSSLRLYIFVYLSRLCYGFVKGTNIILPLLVVKQYQTPLIKLNTSANILTITHTTVSGLLGTCQAISISPYAQLIWFNTQFYLVYTAKLQLTPCYNKSRWPFSF